MLPLHTQKSLDQLTWNEVQKIHASLGLKATATTRTRRDYQRRIVAAMPQPIAEPEAVATPLTCATCPFAVLLEDNRYECGAHVTDAVTRGHWEAKDECYTEIAAQTETIKPAVEVKAPIAPQETVTKTESPITQPEQTPAATTTATNDNEPPNRGDNGRGRVISSLPMPTVTIASIPHATKPKADDNFMTAFTKESEGDRKFNDLAYLSQLEMEAQLAIERTVIGSEEEAIALLELAKIEQDIEFYGKPRPYPQPSPVIEQLETQMNELKAEVKQFTLDTSILALTDEPEPVEASLDPEGTIYWETPLRGTIVGKKGVKRSFYLRNKDYFGDKNYPTVYDIHIIMSADFTASESKRPNIRHKQIRDAIEAGRAFNSLIFKLSSNFERDTEDYNGIGRIRQECDGRWWAWATTGVTGHSFFLRDIACDYLKDVADRHNQAQKQKQVVHSN